MIVTVFRQRTDPDHSDEYADIGKDVVEAAPKIPGFISFKRFKADDGENCTIVEFEDRESHNRWLADPIHRKAMSRGRAAFFTEYTITVCEAIRILQQHPNEHVTVFSQSGDATTSQTTAVDAVATPATPDQTKPEHAATIDTEPNYTSIDQPWHSAGETIDVLASVALSEIELRADVTPLAQRQLRMRRVVVEPGGVIATHPHDNRPTILYIIAGTMLEFSDDSATAIEHVAPAVAIPTTKHWWRNPGTEPAVIIGADLFDPQSDPNAG